MVIYVMCAILLLKNAAIKFITLPPSLKRLELYTETNKTVEVSLWGVFLS